MHETFTKRVIFVAKCDTCDFKDVRVQDPPKQIFDQNCKKWLPYNTESYVGPDRFGSEPLSKKEKVR